MKTKRYFAMLAAMALTGNGLLASPEVNGELAKLRKFREEIQKPTGGEKISLKEKVVEFKVLIESVDLIPSKDIFAVHEEVKNTYAGLFTVYREKNPAQEADDEFASLTKVLLNKLDRLIDEEYKWQHVSANIAPPPGVPNAAAGMNPDAIKDPELKRQYLENFEKERAKNAKNIQQSQLKMLREYVLIYVRNLHKAGEPEETFIEKFSPEGKSRELLRSALTTRK